MDQWILVVEPDRRQSGKLAMLARNQLHVETVIVASVHDAMQILDERVPDLVLISAVLLPRDEAALTERLRQLAAAGLKVSTLRIPILDAPARRLLGPQKGPANRTRPVVHGTRSQDACDPFVFGIQLNAHLERLAAERPAASTAPPARRPAPAPSQPRDPAPIDTATPPSSPKEMVTAEPPPARTRPAEWRTLLSALQRDLDRMKTENLDALPATERVITQLVPQPTRVVAQPAPLVPQPPRAVPQSPRTAAQPPRVAAPQPAGPSASQPTVPVQAQQPAAPSPAPAGGAIDTSRKKKRKSPPPAQDEWGFFDPNQCGLAALRSKLDAIKDPQK